METLKKTTLHLLAEMHQDWIRIVKSFGCNNDTSEDLVQEMYLKINALISRGGNIMYNETEINHYYIFRTLRTMYIDLTRKENKVTILPLERNDLFDKANYERYIAKFTFQNPYDEADDIEGLYEEMQVFLNDLYWYDKKIYQYIEGGESVKSLSDKTKISYYSIYNTYRKVKKDLYSLLRTKIKLSK